MSHKGTEDKEKEGYPFTARQRRQKLGKRIQRKTARPAKVFIKATRKLKKAPKRVVKGMK